MWSALLRNTNAAGLHDQLAESGRADDASKSANSDDDKAAHRHAAIMHRQAASMYDSESDAEIHGHHMSKAKEHDAKGRY